MLGFALGECNGVCSIGITLASESGTLEKSTLGRLVGGCSLSGCSCSCWCSGGGLFLSVVLRWSRLLAGGAGEGAGAEARLHDQRVVVGGGDGVLEE